MKLRLSALFAIFLMFALASCKDKLTGPPNTPTSSSDTIAYWTFDGNTKDVSGNGHDGTLKGTISYNVSDRFGNLGKAIELISPSGEMDVSTAAPLDSNGSYSVSAWVNISDRGYWGMTTGIYGFGGDTSGFQVDILGLGIVRSNQSIKPDVWRMYTLVVTGHSSATLYIDSLMVATKAYIENPGTLDILPSIIGTNTYYSNDSTRLDDIIILRHAMSANEIQARFHEGGWYEHTNRDTVTDSTTHDTSTLNPGWVQDKASVYPNNNESVTGMCWVTPAVGFWCTSDGLIYSSNDSGATWDYQQGVPDNLDGIASPDGLDIITGGGLGGMPVYYSTHGGVTGSWSGVPLADTGNIHTRDVKFFDATHAIAVGGDSARGLVFISSDAGVTWKKERSNGTFNWSTILTSIAIDPNQLGVCTIVGNAGQIFKSNDFGVTWTDESVSGTDFTSVDFANSSVGIAVSSEGAAYRTANGGVSWSLLLPNNSLGKLLAVKMLSPTEAWAAGAGNAIRHTTDGGYTWQKADLKGVTAQWNVISIRDSHHLMFAGTNGNIWQRIY